MFSTLLFLVIFHIFLRFFACHAWLNLKLALMPHLHCLQFLSVSFILNPNFGAVSIRCARCDITYAYLRFCSYLFATMSYNCTIYYIHYDNCNISLVFKRIFYTYLQLTFPILLAAVTCLANIATRREGKLLRR